MKRSSNEVLNHVVCYNTFSDNLLGEVDNAEPETYSETGSPVGVSPDVNFMRRSVSSRRIAG